MKKNYFALLAILASTLSFAQAADSFIGTGALSANGWTKHSGTGTAPEVQIIPNSLTYPGITSAGNKIQTSSNKTEDLNLPSATDITGACFYSFLLNVTDTKDLNPYTIEPSTGSYFMHLAPLAGATVGTLHQAKLAIRSGSVPNTYNLGVFSNGATIATSFTSSNYQPNTTYFVVVKYDLVENTASLWVNPTLNNPNIEKTPNIKTPISSTAAPSQIRSICVRQASNIGTLEIDEIRLGTTWNYVTHGSLSVNQESISGLKIYPNPVTDGNLYIETETNGTKSITIYDLLGKQVLNTSTDYNYIDVNNLKSGMYILKLTEDGRTATKKIVIK